MDKHYHSNVKLILIKGSIEQQTKKWQRHIYFDQYGTLVKKLKIKHVPTLVTQAGLKLLIEEFDLQIP